MEANWNGITPNLVLTNIILFLLGLGTIRSIISASGIVSENGKFFSRLIYGRRHFAMTKEEIIKLGEQLKAENERPEKMKDRHINTDTKCYQELLRLINRCMVKFDEQTRIGDESSFFSEFYIDTMSGIHEEEIQYMMKELMRYLISKYYKVIPKFVITPKNGNPSFGKIMALCYKVPLLLHKHTKDPSRALIEPTGIDTKIKAKNDFRVNFEGSLSDVMTNKHDGILVDCNASSGKQIINAVREFKELINQQEGINGYYPTLKHVFTLFRVNDDKKFDEDIQQNGIKFHCIFILYEDIKHKIYNNGKSLSEVEINGIINELKKRGYLLPQLKRTKPT